MHAHTQRICVLRRSCSELRSAAAWLPDCPTESYPTCFSPAADERSVRDLRAEPIHGLHLRTEALKVHSLNRRITHKDA